LARSRHPGPERISPEKPSDKAWDWS
jgi:hypothetical protein